MVNATVKQMNAVAAQCILVSKQEDMKCFVTSNEANIQNCFDPETVAQHIDFDSEIECCFGSVVILLKQGNFVGWWDAYSGFLFVA